MIKGGLRIGQTDIVRPWLLFGQPQLRRKPGLFPWRWRQLEREAEHSAPSSAEVESVCDLVRLRILTAASMKITAFWDTAPCSLFYVGRQ
jgi:hypothetical protein